MNRKNILTSHKLYFVYQISTGLHKLDRVYKTLLSLKTNCIMVKKAFSDKKIHSNKQNEILPSDAG